MNLADNSQKDLQTGKDGNPIPLGLVSVPDSFLDLKTKLVQLKTRIEKITHEKEGLFLEADKS
jgi:hypothetical protein